MPELIGPSLWAPSAGAGSAPWRRHQLVRWVPSTSVGQPVGLDIGVVMRGRGGVIINIASIGGLLGDYGTGAYNASKAAMVNYTHSLALDCARHAVESAGPPSTSLRHG